MPEELEPDVLPDAVPDPVVGDVSVYTAKIAELEGLLESANAAVAAKQIELDAQKAANYDLLMAVPSDTPSEPTNDTEDDEAPEVDDFFGDDNKDKD